MWFFGLNAIFLFSVIFNILYDIMSFSSERKIIKELKVFRAGKFVGAISFIFVFSDKNSSRNSCVLIWLLTWSITNMQIHSSGDIICYFGQCCQAWKF